MQITNTFGLASIRTEPNAHIARHDVEGVVTPNTIADLVASACEIQSHAMVVSYEAAVVAIEADTMFGYAWQPDLRVLLMEAPAALLVRPDQLSMFQEYSRTAMKHGLLRAAFTSSDQAYRWAAEQAAVQESLRETVRRLIANEGLRHRATAVR